MKQAAKIIVFLLGVTVLGALLAPVVFWFFRKLEPLVLANGLMNWDPQDDSVLIKGPLGFVTTDFERCFNRALLLSAVLLFVPAARMLGIHRWRELQLRPDPRRWRHLIRGFLVTAALVGLTGASYVLANHWRLPAVLPWGRLPKPAAVAIGVAVLQEFIFRGMLLGFFLRAMRPAMALFWSSFFFAAAGMLKPDGAAAITQVQWLSGFELLPHLFQPLTEPMTLLTGFAALFTRGWLFGYARLRTDALWLSIGLALGASVANEAFTACALRDPEILPWIGPDLRTGLIPVLALLLALFLVSWRLKYEELLPDPKPHD